jgi:hypothetical protein
MEHAASGRTTQPSRSLRLRRAPDNNPYKFLINL